MGSAIVEVDADGDHAGEDFGGGLHLPDTGLVDPGDEAGEIALFGDGDDAVLMPAEIPVGLGNFVEEDGACGEGVVAENGSDELAGSFRGGECADFGRIFEEVADAVDVLFPTDGFAIGDGFNGGLECFDQVEREDAFGEGIAMSVEVVGVIVLVEGRGPIHWLGSVRAVVVDFSNGG